MHSPQMNSKSMLKAGIVVLLSFLSSACETLSYYGQAARGQVSLLVARRSIDAVVADPATDDRLRTRLKLVQSARRFAAFELKLPLGKRYASYVDVGRRHVVWNVFAAPELSLAPRQWCYPIVGCAPYRGYFAESNAQNYARRMQEEGWEVYVGGVAAYSTLGWFDDPILSTFIDYSEADLVGLIFHELSHSLIFVKGDAVFNESFATFVEHEGLARWFATKPPSSAFQAFEAERQRRHQFTEFLLRYRRQFEALYRSQRADDAKRVEKQRLFDLLRSEYAERRADFGVGYQRYVDELNNARLATIATYHTWVPAFRKLYEQSADLDEFFVRVRALSELDFDTRRAELQALIPANESTMVNVSSLSDKKRSQ